jgi:hypothetical protein
LGLVFGGHFCVRVGDEQEVLGAVSGHSNPGPGAGFKNLRRPSFETLWKVDGRGHFGDNYISAAGTDLPGSLAGASPYVRRLRSASAWLHWPRDAP